jgi:hypothetical protein
VKGRAKSENPRTALYLSLLEVFTPKTSPDTKTFFYIFFRMKSPSCSQISTEILLHFCQSLANLSFSKLEQIKELREKPHLVILSQENLHSR